MANEFINQLIDIGLSKEEAIKALKLSGNDVQKAISIYFGDISPEKELLGQQLEQRKEVEENSNIIYDIPSATNIRKVPDIPCGLLDSPIQPLASVLVALSYLDPLKSIIQGKSSNQWTSTLETPFTDELLRLFTFMNHSKRKFTNAIAITNALSNSLPMQTSKISVPDTVSLILQKLSSESSLEISNALKKILSIQVLRESVSSMSETMPCITLSAFYHDKDLRIWLSNSLQEPLTFLYPVDQPSKLLILNFPQLASLRVPESIYIDCFLKKNNVIMKNKRKENQLLVEEITKLQLQLTQKYPKNKIQMIKNCNELLKERPDLVDRTVSDKLFDYLHKKQKAISELESQIHNLQRRTSAIFEVSALLKEDMKLHAIFVNEHTQTNVYMKNGNQWFLYSNGHVSIAQEDMFDKSIDNISCIWYQKGLDADLVSVDMCPEWMENDNNELESQMDLL